MDWPTSYKFYVTIISSSDQRRDLYNVDVFWSPDLSSSAFMSNTKPFLYRTSSWSPGLSKESLEPCCVWSSSVPIKVLDWSMSSSRSSNQWCSPPRTGWWMETSSRVSLCSNSCGHQPESGHHMGLSVTCEDVQSWRGLPGVSFDSSSRSLRNESKSNILPEHIVLTSRPQNNKWKKKDLNSPSKRIWHDVRHHQKEKW